MSLVEQSLVTYLGTQAGVTALVGTRIEPVENVQSQTLPAVSYQVISGPIGYSHDGSALQATRIQLTVTATTYSSLVALSNALQSALAGIRYTVDERWYVSQVQNVVDGLAPQAGQAGYYIRRIDVVIWHAT